MEEAPTDSAEELGDRIVELHHHLQMLQRQLRDGMRRFEALRRRHNPLPYDLGEAHARMNVVRPDVARSRAARANAVVSDPKRNSRVSAEASRIADRPKLKPLALALALKRG